MPPVRGKKKADQAPDRPVLKPDPAIDRPVIYPEPVVKEYRKFPDADMSLTVADAKDILGWEEEGLNDKFGDDHVHELFPLVGRKVRLVYNTRNRPIDVPWLLTLRQEHLNLRWRMNWETIVVSKTRQVNSGQHRLLSLILAELERLKDLGLAGHWRKNWPGPVTMESLVVFGAEEDDDTFKTFNCGRPMSFADVLFRSDLLQRFEPPKRRGVAKVLDRAVQTVWDRTGLKHDAYARRRTHGEADDFLRRHTRLVRAAEHIWEETSDNKLAAGNLGVGPGTAAGLLYLFGVSDTDPAGWRGAAEPTETALDFSLWDRAEEFFALLGGSSPDLRGVREVIGEVADPDKGNGTAAEYTAVLVKAWNTFRTGENPKAVDCRLEYDTDGDGDRHYKHKPDVGGIDRGPDGGKKEEAPPAGGDPGGDGGEEPAKKPIPSKAQQEADAAAPPSRVDLVDSAKATLNTLREEHAGKVLLFQTQTGNGWRAFEQDAKIVSKLCGLTPVKNGVLQVAFPGTKAKEVVAALHAAGHRVAAVFETEAGPVVEDYTRPGPEAPGASQDAPKEETQGETPPKRKGRQRKS